MTSKNTTPRISVIVIFFNMRREAKRTLFSLSSAYQKHVKPKNWEVIAIDNGSTEPLNQSDVAQFGENFRYYYFDTHSVSPVEAINFGVKKSCADYVSISIDGARILSPGILEHTLNCIKAFESPFICTLGFHLGAELQNTSMLKGYDQNSEDRLLETIDWRNKGYDFFSISTLAASSPGFFAPICESNFCTLKKSIFEREKGFDSGFTAPGGGTANLDFYKRISELKDVQTIHLLGEGTFHQFHGGVATNVPLSEHPSQKNQAQYQFLRGEKYERPDIETVYVGKMPDQAKRFIVY